MGCNWSQKDARDLVKSGCLTDSGLLHTLVSSMFSNGLQNRAAVDGQNPATSLISVFFSLVIPRAPHWL